MVESKHDLDKEKTWETPQGKITKLSYNVCIFTVTAFMINISLTFSFTVWLNILSDVLITSH